MSDGKNIEKPFKVIDYHGEIYIKVGDFYVKPMLSKQKRLVFTVWEAGKKPHQTDAMSVDIIVERTKEMKVSSW